MVVHSVLVPLHNAAAAVREQLPGVCDALDLLGEPYEIVLVDDGSRPRERAALVELAGQWPSVRLVQLERRCGTSVAVAAGIAAADGELVVAIEPGDRYPPWQIGKLLAGLSRGDLVWGRRSWPAWLKWLRRAGRVPRWLLLGLEVRDPDCLFWAARREAVEQVQFSRGTLRYLPTLVALAGYRVCECGVDANSTRWRLPDEWPNPGDLLATWWLRRRRRPCRVHEVQVPSADVPLRMSA